MQVTELCVFVCLTAGAMRRAKDTAQWVEHDDAWAGAPGLAERWYVGLLQFIPAAIYVQFFEGGSDLQIDDDNACMY